MSTVKSVAAAGSASPKASPTASPTAAPAGAPAPGGILKVQLVRAGLEGQVDREDQVAVEAPLEIQLHHPSLGQDPVSFGTTMRTPGDDESLAAGLLYGEGILNQLSDVEAIEASTRRPNVVNVRLRSTAPLEINIATRRFSAGSSCGVCGTTGLDAAITRAAATRVDDAGRVELGVLLGLPDRMRGEQAKFGSTGGIHAAALFDSSGTLLGIAEDVGRHNAFDKLVGENFLAGSLPLTGRIVTLSGRASFELVQKAIRAGVSIVAAIGAPSSLAVNLSAASGMTLVGFLREKHCNIYAHPERLVLPARALR